MEAVTAKPDATKTKRYFKESDSVQFAGEVTQANNWAKPFRPDGDGQQKKRKRPFKIDRNAVARHSRGSKATTKGIKTDFFQQKVRRNEVYTEFSAEQAARTEILRIEDEGFVVYFAFNKLIKTNVFLTDTLKTKMVKTRPSTHNVKLWTMLTLRRPQNIST